MRSSLEIRGAAPNAVTAAAPLPAAETRAYGDAPNRLVAYAIDAVLVTILVFAASICVSVLAGPVVEFDEAGSGGIDVNERLAGIDAIVATALSLAYFVATWTWLQGSPGQRALRMRLGDERGGAVGLGRAALRWLPLGLPVGVAGLLIIVLPGYGDLLVDLLLVAWFVLLLATIARSPTKQGWHDRLASTVVVKQIRPVTEPPAGPDGVDDGAR